MNGEGKNESKIPSTKLRYCGLEKNDLKLLLRLKRLCSVSKEAAESKPELPWHIQLRCMHSGKSEIVTFHGPNSSLRCIILMFPKARIHNI